jgi:hypothetical protein
MTWNPNEEEESVSDFIVEKGAYLCVVTSAESHMKDINTRGIKLTLQVCHPNASLLTKFENRRIFLYYTWDNKNSVAVKLGRQKLADLLYAVNEMKACQTPDDVCDLVINKEVIANVVVTKRTDTGDNRNEVKMYFRKDGTHRGAKQTQLIDKWGGIPDALPGSLARKMEDDLNF